jgi:signal transduction histidine kinase
LPRLTTFIRTNAEQILTEWENFARGLPGGETMDIKALRDHAKAMLQVIAKDLESPQTGREQSDKSRGLSDAEETAEPGSGERHRPTAAQEHGAGRAESGFTVEAMVAEFRALRASVIRLWAVEQRQPSPADFEDVTRFNEAIDQAIAESIMVYTRDVRLSKDRFLAILGHDLRTPIGAIITSTRFMLDTGELVEPHLSLVTRVEQSARRMNRMVTDLLEFTRTRFGDTIPVQRAEMDLGAVIRDVASEVLASNPSLTLRVSTDGDLQGQWDCERLTQALTNLVSNAVHHGDVQRPITVRGERHGDEVTVAVHNEGRPIPPEQLGRLFEPMKEMTAVPRDRRHLGLGLYIVDRIVAAHGGTLEVESNARLGTTFTMRLPVAGPVARGGEKSD